MKMSLSILLIAASISTHAQSWNTDNFRIFVNQPLLFSYSNIEELSDPKAICDAIELQVRSKQHTRNVSAHINFNGINNNTILENWVSLRLSRKTATKAIFNTTETKLNSKPTLLFSQPGSRAEELYSFNYDVILNSVSTFVRNGNYSFSITFTMTEP